MKLLLFLKLNKPKETIYIQYIKQLLIISVLASYLILGMKDKSVFLPCDVNFL